MVARFSREFADCPKRLWKRKRNCFHRTDRYEGIANTIVKLFDLAAGMKLRGRCRGELISLDETAEGGAAEIVNKLADAGPTPERICEQTERQEMLRKALAQISPKLRTAFQIREIAGLSTSKAAAALRITKNTLKSRIRRAQVAVGLHFEKAGGAQALRTNRGRRQQIANTAL
jgi:RNA polymerase sigma factor (sigma-70 family)